MSAPGFHVEAGRGSMQIELPGSARLTKLSVGPMDNNCYLLQPDLTRDEVVVIDAAADAVRIIQALAQRSVTAVITTHQHHDHWQALAEVAAHTAAPLLAGAPDVDAIGRGSGVFPEARWTGDRIPCGQGELEVIGLVGHTPGSIALLWTVGDQHHLFTGDSLFPGGPGKTDGEANFTSLMDDLESRIFAALPDETFVHPGHGDGTTLGAERPQLAQWRARGW